MQGKVLGIKHNVGNLEFPTSDLAIEMPDGSIGICEMPTQEALEVFRLGTVELKKGEPNEC
jgi:hypothetical protein